MTWKIECSPGPSQTRLESERAWFIQLDLSGVRDAAIGLSLLLQELVADVEFSGSSTAERVRLALGRRKGRYRAIATVQDRGVRFDVSRDELEGWLVFLLETIRDGRAAVDHLDLSTEQSTPEGWSETLVLKFIGEWESVSGQTARERLGL